MSTLELFMMQASPPSYAIMALLKEMNIPYKRHELDFFGGDQFKANFVKMNPQREVPVLKDGDYSVNESIAILQYICDAYGKDHQGLYPKDPKKRGLVNHRLAYNLCNFYPNVSTFTFGAVYGVPNADQMKGKALRSLAVLERILKDQGTTYAAGDTFTIADIALLTTAICMEAAGFDSSPYPCIAKWYETCKKQHPKMWAEFQVCRDDLHSYFNGPTPTEALGALNKLREESFKNI